MCSRSRKTGACEYLRVSALPFPLKATSTNHQTLINTSRLVTGAALFRITHIHKWLTDADFCYPGNGCQGVVMEHPLNVDHLCVCSEKVERTEITRCDLLIESTAELFPRVPLRARQEISVCPGNNQSSAGPAGIRPA